MTTTPAEPIRALHGRLRAEHLDMDRLLERLIEAYETGDREVSRTALREFDKRLAAHLAMEDDLLLPAFANVDRADAERIAAEHRAIRARVDELAIGSDLHLTRLPAIRELAESLRAHAKHEDDVLYRWIDREYGDAPPSASPASPVATPSH